MMEQGTQYDVIETGRSRKRYKLNLEIFFRIGILVVTEMMWFFEKFASEWNLTHFHARP